MVVARPVDILRGYRAFEEALAVSRSDVKSLVRFNAEQKCGVIARDKAGRLRADKAELWELYKRWCSALAAVGK
ncbi:MAG: hypothetical protein AB7D57_11415 [Desulfovibrionaceae bacterium]